MATELKSEGPKEGRVDKKKKEKEKKEKPGETKKRKTKRYLHTLCLDGALGSGWICN